jgi:hypothetical protein
MIIAGDTVRLDGSKSSDPGGDPITLSWSETGGPSVILSNRKSSNPTFIAPKPQETPPSPTSREPIKLIFELTVNDGKLSSIASQVIITVGPCTAEEQKKADETNTLVSKIIAYQTSHGYPEAAKRFEHWRPGSAAPMPLELKWLQKSGDFNGKMHRLHSLYETNFGNEGAGNSILKTARSMNDGETRTLVDNWKAAITSPNPFTDFGAAVGRAQIVSDGTITISRQGNFFLVKGTVNFQLEDRFNFNPGDVFPIPAPPFRVSAHDLNLLEKCKDAKQFIQGIKWKEEVSGRTSMYGLSEIRALNWVTIP